MLRALRLVALLIAMAGMAMAQSAPRHSDAASPAQRSVGQQPPRSNDEDAPPAGADESSSKDTKVDLSPPSDDVKAHPKMLEPDTSDVSELKPWDPHRAMHNVEVGDFQFKRGNYPAAESRYREALEYKPNDAEATMRLATTLEKEGKKPQAIEQYQAYLRILPHGPEAEKAKTALQRLGGTIPDLSQASAQPPMPQSDESADEPKRGLKRHLKEHFSSWCVSAIGTVCTHPKDPQGSPEPAKPQPAPQDPSKAAPPQ
jgi:tetratricopeptide (TPR) repeat protein